MSDKPATVPRWAHDGTNEAANVQIPASGKQDVGWAAGEEPGSAHQNWFMRWVYAWLAWLNIGYFTRPSLTDRTPVIAFTDQDGNERHYVDPNGYFFGPALQVHYMFNELNIAASQTDAVVGEAPFTMLTTTDLACTNQAVPPSGTVQRGRSLRCQNAAVNDGVSMYSAAGSGASGTALFGNPDDVVAVCEYRLKVETVGANNVVVNHGFHSAPNDNSVSYTTNSARSFAMFEKDSADTNWQCRTGNNTSGEDLDSGVPPVADTYQTFRIEFHGLNTPQGVDNGGDPLVRFFIDGALVATSTANGPTSVEALGLSFRNYANGTGPAADLDVTVEEGVKAAWNMVLDPSVPA